MDHELVVSKTVAIDRPVDVIWRVLTEPRYVKQYLYGADLITDWTVGSPVTFRGEFQGHPWQDHGIVLHFEPSRRLQYSYYSGSCGLDDRPEHYATVTYELRETSGGATLTVRQQGYPNEQSRNSSDGGWETLLAQMKSLAEAE